MIKLHRGNLSLKLTTWVVLLCWTFPLRAETLADVLVAAYLNSGLIEQNRALLRAADEDVAIAAAKLKPILNWSSSVARSHLDSETAFGAALESTTTYAIAGLSAEFLLYDSGISKMSVEANKQAVLAARQKLVAVEQSVLLRAVEAFMTVRRDTDQVNLRDNNLKLIKEELRAAKDRFAVGEVTRTDVALAEARLAASRSALAAADGALAVAVEEYKAVIGQAPGVLSASNPELKQVKDLAAAKAVALKQHPDIKAAQYRVAIADLAVKQAELAKRPKVALLGSIALTEYDGSDAYSRSGDIKLQASGPLYLGGQIPAALRKSRAMQDMERKSLHLVSLGVSQNVGTAFARLQVATAAKEASASQIRAARVAFQGVRQEAAFGARTTLDVLNAEQELLDAQTSMVSALADQQIAAYTLRATLGQMTADKLGLDVPKYNPEAYFATQGRAPKTSVQGAKLDRILKALGKN